MLRTYMKTILSLLIFTLSSLFVFGQSTETNAVASALKSGNAAAIKNYMASTVNLSIENGNDFYPKAQATQVLSSFFSKHKVANFTLEHDGKSRRGGSVYNIGKLDTNNGTFRVSFHLVNENNMYLIKQIRIESATF